MRIRIDHATRYAYARPARRIVQMLRLTPRSNEGQQVLEWRIDTDIDARVELLKDEYGHFLLDPAALGRRLDCLVQLHGTAAIRRWKEMAQRSEWDAVVRELLERHYDPAYTCSIAAHYPDLSRARTVRIAAYRDESFLDAARVLMEAPSSAAATTVA